MLTTPRTPVGAAKVAPGKRYVLRVKARDGLSGVRSLQVANKHRRSRQLVRYKRKLVIKRKTRPVWVRVRDR